MSKGRLEAFSDGVFAIIITIMVLEFKRPAQPELSALLPLWPVGLSYVLSFVYVGIYWNNHHHLFQAAKQVNGRVLWANMHLLFWLSLTPFATAWMGESAFAAWPVVLYGVILWLAGFAYYLLARALIAHHGADSTLATALGSDRKGCISQVLYAIGIGSAFLSPALAFVIYIAVAVLWFVPDRRIERALT
jgi:uncharacterized membrane protein